jgi:hypothetical protein
MIDTPAAVGPDRIPWATGWRARGDSVLGRPTGSRGSACAPLEPYSGLMPPVTSDGEHLGHVRLDGGRERWVAVGKAAAGGRPDGRYATPQDEARTLARAAGKTIGESR